MESYDALTPYDDDADFVEVEITYRWSVPRRWLSDFQAGVEGAQEYLDAEIMTDVVHSTDPNVREVA